MDLTTTSKIKRRIITIIPDSTQDSTPASIEVSNWMNSTDLTNKKMRISSFYFNNSKLCCFVPKWAAGLPPANWQQTGGTVTTENNALSIDTLDYAWNLYNSGTTTSHGGIINMDALRSNYPNLRPATHPDSEYAQLTNKYYWFFDTSRFLDLIIQQINTVINTYNISTGVEYGIQLVRTDQGYGLYLPTVIRDAGYVLQFSKTLIDLFQFKNSQASNSSYLYTIEFNPTVRNYFVENVSIGGSFSSQPCIFVNSNYVPDFWFPFDQLLIRTDAPVESEMFYNNNNYISQNYQNIMLTYRLSNNNPDGIYNFYESDIDPASGWISLVNTNTRDNIKIDILLRFSKTKDLIAYPIGPGENFYFVVESIETTPPLI